MDIKTRVKQHIAEQSLMDGPLEISDDASFLDRGLLDSTGVLELIVFIEQEFGIAISQAEAIPENLDSLQSIERFVTRKLAASGDNPCAAA